MKQMQVLVVIQDTSSGSLEGIIRPSIFGMGNHDVLPKQVERLVEHSAHLALVSWKDKIGWVDHHFQGRGLHCRKQRVAFCCGIYHVCTLRFKGQRYLLFLSNPQRCLYGGQQIGPSLGGGIFWMPTPHVLWISGPGTKRNDGSSHVMTGRGQGA